jgi:Protein of unknown function (DUF3429)
MYSPTANRLIDRLGYAGLLPFIGGAALLWLVEPGLHPFVALGLAGYGAVIVSFLGGIHWGIGLRYAGTMRTTHAFHFVWGVVPSLLAWVALMMPAFAGLPLLALVLVVCFAVDYKTWPGAGLGEWLPLRFRLTAVAAVSCLIGAGGT